MTDTDRTETNVPMTATESSQPDAAVAYVAPFVALMVISMLYPKFENAAFGEEQIADPAATRRYLGLIGLQLIVAAVLLSRFWRVYIAQFRFRVSPLAIVTGTVGVVLWIGVCGLGLERRLFAAVGLEQLNEVRSSFDPFVQFDSAGMRGLFFVMRFTLLAMVVPIVEELFLRGWFARWFDNPDWQQLGLQSVTTSGLLAIAGYAVLTHPSEAFAAVLWFSLVSWLMLRTGNLWDCIVAHAVTNLLLGIYVVATRTWHLW